MEITALQCSAKCPKKGIPNRLIPIPHGSPSPYSHATLIPFFLSSSFDTLYYHPQQQMCPRPLFSALCLVFFGRVFAQSVAPPPSQPLRPGQINNFEIVGDSLVSGQQLFLGTPRTVYVVDKAENNPPQVNGHPAWASAFDVDTNSARAMDIITNSFCAGGNVLGNGTWMNVGGNLPVTYGGGSVHSPDVPPYANPDGRRSVRLLDPCDDPSCNWILAPDLTTERWYPTLETLEDGTMLILGGSRDGAYVNNVNISNPTIEFFPSRGDPFNSPILETTLPVNLFPLTWLLPSGRILIQSNFKTVLLDYNTHEETPLDDIPGAVRTYPASGGTVMLPLTPANQYTATILFCGGVNLQSDQWVPTGPIILSQNPASTSCVRITPDTSGSYVQDDPLPEGRTMGNLIFLPTGKIFEVNGAHLGTAGYGNDSSPITIGHSYADEPLLTPILYDPLAPAGQRWSRDGLGATTVPRMYHSTATLLVDGSVLVTGSNPNPDYTVGPDVRYPTEYRVEKFYPSYYNQRRPEPSGLLTRLSYGGPSFDVSLSSQDLFGDVNNIKTAKVVVIRPGFSTHTMNMGQRYLELNSTYSGFTSTKTGVLHVTQMPPNAAIFAPGPAFVFVVVNDVPSVGIPVMVGSGQLGAQQILPIAPLPVSSLAQSPTQTGQPTSTSTRTSGSVAIRVETWYLAIWILMLFALR